MDITLEHPFYSARKHVTKLCKPLFAHTPFDYFCYELYYFDGYYVTVGSNIDFFRDIYKNNLLPNLQELQGNTSHYVFLSSSIPLLETSLEKNKFAENIVVGENFNINHRLYLVFNTKEYVETFGFGLTCSVNNAIEVFMSNLQLLEKFCAYFREASGNLLQTVQSDRIIFDNITAPVLFSDLNFKNTETYSDFLHEIKLKNYRMQGKQGACLLSKREFECLLWSAKDKSAKQIGRLLSLSPRTVEDYLCNIKNKLGCESKFELIDMACKNPLIKSFIE